LVDAGIIEAISPSRIIPLPRPTYDPVSKEPFGILNAAAIRAFDLRVAELVSDAFLGGALPILVGGDCSILLGALAGIRKSSEIMLIHLDGHSDFRHPGNYDPGKTPGAVAGMDLAIATGRGDESLTRWPGLESPLVADEDVLQLGERESRNVDWAWPDIRSTAIHQVDIFEMKKRGRRWVQQRVDAFLSRSDRPFWIHLDVDVLDERLMPAVDSPGRPGLSTSDLVRMICPLVRKGAFAGISITVFDPDMDPEGVFAERIVRMVKRLFH